MSYKQRQTLAKARRAKLEKGAAVALVGAPSTSARVSVVDIGERELQRVDKRRARGFCVAAAGCEAEKK